MQSKKRSFADVDPEPTSNHDNASSRAQLSANMTRRLENLAPWRIDSSLIEFPKLGHNFEGGCAVVSRALLSFLSNDAKAQVLEPKTEAEGSKEGGKRRNDDAADGQKRYINGETSRRRKPVAVKKMKVKTKSDVVRVLGLAIREAEFLVSHSHENIMKLEGFVEDRSKNVFWLVFPWEENGTLKDFIASAEWEIPERISLLYDVAKGLEYLHNENSPICHGDLKSANILVNSKCRAVITDFGSARRPITEHPDRQRKGARIDPEPTALPEATFCPSTNTITLTHNNCTLRWAAPELLEEGDASLASDVWAFGCVGYEVMTDSVPFGDVKDDAKVVMRVVRGDLPSISRDARMLLIQALCTLVGQCWSIYPTQRPTADECRRAIGWMPMIVPNPARTGDAADLSGYSAELMMQLGYMHRRQNDYPNALKYFVKALSRYTVIANRNGKASALLGLAEIQGSQNNHSQAVASYSDALQIYKDIGNREGRAFALLGLAGIHLVRNEYHQAVIFFSECLQIFTDIGNRLGRSYALSGLARVHWARSEYGQAVTLYPECLQIQTNIGDREGRAYILWNVAEVYRVQSEYNQAITLYSECLQIYTELGNRYGRACTLRGLADVDRLQNKYRQAATLYSECLQIYTDTGDKRMGASALWGLAEIHRLQKAYSQAVTLYSECLQVCTESSDRYGTCLALCGLADVYRARNELSQAIAFYSRCLQIRTDIDDTHGRASALFGLAEVHRLRGEYSQAGAVYSECLQIRIAIGDRLGRAEALFGLAEMHRLRTKYSQALKLFSKALKISIDIGSIYWKAFILFGLADTHHAKAHYNDALHHYEQAAEAFQQLGDTTNETAARTRVSDTRQLLAQRPKRRFLAKEFGPNPTKPHPGPALLRRWKLFFAGF